MALFHYPQLHYIWKYLFFRSKWQIKCCLRVFIFFLLTERGCRIIKRNISFFCVSNVTDEKSSSRATRRQSYSSFQLHQAHHVRKHAHKGQQFTAYMLLETEISWFISYPDHLSATVGNQYTHYQTINRTHNERTGAHISKWNEFCGHSFINLLIKE